AVHRRPSAATRHRGLERRTACHAHNSRQHGRHRPGKSAGDRAMNGVHDMGGMHGFGAVLPEKDEPVFHARWEGRVLGMQRAMGSVGLWNIDMSRASVEQLPPHIYLGVSYYEKWERGLESRLLA